MITGGRDQHDNILSSQVYHLLNGSWSLVTLPDQSQYQNVVFDGAFGPDEAWIEGDTNAIAGAIGAIASGVGVFEFEFWHDDRAWSGGAPSSDELLWFLRR